MPNIQPEVGNGMNASWDSSTNSFVVSNDVPSWIWFRVYNRVQPDTETPIYYYYFQEVEWNGGSFSDKEGGLKLNQATQNSGPKAFPMPFIFDRKDSIQPTNDFNIQWGCIVPAQYMGTDPKDGRDVYYFWCGINPNNRYFIRIDVNQDGGPIMFGSRYSATVCYVNSYSDPIIGGGSAKVWAVEQNGSPLLPGKVYNGFSIGYWNPGNPIIPNAISYNDDRPLVLCVKQGSSGPNAIKVVTGATNNGGSLVFTYATFCPDEYTAILQQQSQGLKLIDLLDTPKNYGTANQLLATNGSGSFFYINSSSVGIQWPTPPLTGSSLILINSGGGISRGSQSISSANMSLDISGSYLQGITIKLKNDMEYPGPNMYYGTDSNGVRGWYPLP
jgi:hypothetical protein